MPRDPTPEEARQFLGVYKFFDLKAYRLEKNTVGRRHLFVDALLSDRVHGTEEAWKRADWSEVQSFVVQHDWAAAFKHATDYLDADDFRLPFPSCCFEFRISGYNVFVMANERDEKTSFVSFVGLGEWWVLPTAEQGSQSLLWAQEQIKAICVALEANVAISETVGAPTRLNRKRVERGREPLRPYHVVNLARRHVIERGESTGTGTHKRLHFRRGHWRHYENKTIWIKWTLVGDPDLGWVEKEYRL
jgi:hypothetical protein